MLDFSSDKSSIKLCTAGAAFKMAENQIICLGGWYDSFNSITERTFVVENIDKEDDIINNANVN